jgi:thermostable 8-oxoguanine DNA glycosylase
MANEVRKEILNLVESKWSKVDSIEKLIDDLKKLRNKLTKSITMYSLEDWQLSEESYPEDDVKFLTCLCRDFAWMEEEDIKEVIKRYNKHPNKNDKFISDLIEDVTEGKIIYKTFNYEKGYKVENWDRWIFYNEPYICY